jgi:Kef-type K+ transport system membrane component KefB
LLANTNYRAQVQADIVPFKGILLGIFFMEAGSSFELELVVSDWPAILLGSISLIAMKAATLFLSTKVQERFEPNRLPMKDAVRLSLLLAGGGEFAFVVLALAEKLEVLPVELGSILTAIILITMAVTPVLGVIARAVTEKI